MGETFSAAALASRELEQYRGELSGYCYRMLGSPFDAEDAVQDTLVRAWQSLNRFEGRSTLRSWLYRIATNVCLDMLGSRQRRARPMDLGPPGEPTADNLRGFTEATWLEPFPDPADAAITSDSIRLAFVAALQHLPPRQRATLILCDVLRWRAGEVAQLLETSVAAVNSALQRARVTLEKAKLRPKESGEIDQSLLDEYVRAFEAYDFKKLASLIHEEAVQSMPPYDLWLRGRDDVFAWWVGPGIGCKGSRVIPTVSANGSPAFGQYKPHSAGGYQPWALQVLEISRGRIVELTFFLSTERLFPVFGLPPRLDS